MHVRARASLPPDSGGEPCAIQETLKPIGGGDLSVEENGERSGAQTPVKQVKFDLSKRTGQHIRLIVRIPQEDEHEGQD
jgi:hypothetical protein